MKKVLLILITLISVCAHAQTYKISQLAGTKWILCWRHKPREKSMGLFRQNVKDINVIQKYKQIQQFHV